MFNGTQHQRCYADLFFKYRDYTTLSPYRMSAEIERNLGEQPLARIMSEGGLKSQDLVAASTEQINHKMVARACKGRRLTANVKAKIHRALNAASGKEYALGELFNY